MKNYKAIIFDFDGTLMDTNGVIVESWNEVYRYVTGHDADLETVKGTFGEILEDTMKKTFPDEEQAPLLKIYRGYQGSGRYKERIDLFPGTREMIEDLRAKGYRLAIVTSRAWKSTPKNLYHFDIEDRFEALVTAEDTHAHKPDPTPILICLEKLGLKADECLYVGDSKFDILCAHNAGVDAMLVGWTWCLPRDQWEVYAPEYVIEEPAELSAMLPDLN